MIWFDLFFRAAGEEQHMNEAAMYLINMHKA